MSIPYQTSEKLEFISIGIFMLSFFIYFDIFLTLKRKKHSRNDKLEEWKKSIQNYLSIKWYFMTQKSLKWTSHLTLILWNAFILWHQSYGTVRLSELWLCSWLRRMNRVSLAFVISRALHFRLRCFAHTQYFRSPFVFAQIYEYPSNTIFREPLWPVT